MGSVWCTQPPYARFGLGGAQAPNGQLGNLDSNQD
jgi:hypothetical protein